jgi:hypothetical protein
MLIEQFSEPRPLPLSSAVFAMVTVIIMVAMAIFGRISIGRESGSRRLDFRPRRCG